jgi:hypothetical protein
MADNTTLNAGAGGDVIASDDISGVKYQRVKLTLGVDGVNDGDVSTSNLLPVATDHHSDVSTNNSTSTPLGISATFTGTGEDVHDYGALTCQLYADEDSAANGMTFQFSTDNTNWDDVYSFTMTGGETRRFQFPVCAQYFRLVYTNGTTAQTVFRVQTLLKHTNTLTSIHKIEDNVSTDRSAQLVKAGLIAQVNGTGDFIPVQSTAGGILKVGGTVDVDDISAGTQTNDVKVTLDGETVTIGTALPAGSNNIGDVDVVSSALPTGAATAANQLPDGHNVTIDNASGASAVNIQDGGNSITVDGSVSLAAAIPAGTNNIGDVDIASALPAGDNNIGNVDVVTLPALPAGTNNIGDVDIASITAGSNLIGDVGVGVRTSGGTTIFRSLDLDETEEQIKGTAGQVYWIMAFNVATAVRYLKFYNATDATVVVGTTTPVLTIPIPTQNASANGAGFVLSIPNGIAFSTAITVAATTGVADNDTGAPGANEVIVNIGYA